MLWHVSAQARREGTGPRKWRRRIAASCAGASSPARAPRLPVPHAGQTHSDYEVWREDSVPIYVSGHGWRPPLPYGVSHSSIKVFQWNSVIVGGESLQGVGNHKDRQNDFLSRGILRNVVADNKGFLKSIPILLLHHYMGAQVICSDVVLVVIKLGSKQDYYGTYKEIRFFTYTSYTHTDIAATLSIYSSSASSHHQIFERWR